MDLYASDVIIERKLIGVPEVRQAERIEHFGQAPHVRAFEREEVRDNH